MAKGRFISKSIGHSREIAALPDDTARMVFAFILPYLDVEGRIDADPIYLTGVCLSRLRVPPEVIARSLVAMFEVGLIELYEEYGLPYVQFVNFEKHQQGLRKDREDTSLIPPPSGRFPPEFERFLKAAPITETPKTENAVQEYEVPRSDGARMNAGGLPQTPESPAEDAGVRLSPSLSSSLSRSRRLRAEAQSPAEPNPPAQPSALSPQNQPAAPATLVKDRNPTFKLIDQKLGYRRGSETDPERVSLLAECLLERPERDAWLELPPDSVRRLIRDATEHYRRHGDFKGQLIKLLDQTTRAEQKTHKQGHEGDEWGRLIAEYEAQTGEVYQE